MDRYWIIEDHESAPDGYVAIVDEEEGGVLLYVVAHASQRVLDLLTTSSS